MRGRRTQVSSKKNAREENPSFIQQNVSVEKPGFIQKDAREEKPGLHPTEEKPGFVQRDAIEEQPGLSLVWVTGMALGHTAHLGG